MPKVHDAAAVGADPSLYDRRFVGDAGDDEDEEMKGPGLLCGAAWRKLRAAGPPNSHGWLDGGARSQNPGSKVVFLFGPGGHLDPPNVWSIDSPRRDDAHGDFDLDSIVHL